MKEWYFSDAILQFVSGNDYFQRRFGVIQKNEADEFSLHLMKARKLYCEFVMLFNPLSFLFIHNMFTFTLKNLWGKVSGLMCQKFQCIINSKQSVKILRFKCGNNM